MARHKRHSTLEIVLGIAQVGALLVVAAVFVPTLRQRLLSGGPFVGGAVILIGVAALSSFLIRRRRRKSSLCIPAPATTADLLERLRAIDWFQFEKLVTVMYRKRGYTVTRRGGANPDGGIDLVIEKEGERRAVQCKQWKTRDVGVKAMREFLGALTDARIEKGVFITLCGYTGEARQLAEKHRIEIVDEVGLARMLDSTGAVIDPDTLAILRDTRKFCPRCESEMVLRTATKGPDAGKQFWGCSDYPRCAFTMPV